MVRRVLDLRSIFAIIPKSDDDAAFSRLFRDISDRLASEMPTQTFVPRALGIATSGTYAVTPSADPVPVARRARK